jgi:hypothetical protein
VILLAAEADDTELIATNPVTNNAAALAIAIDLVLSDFLNM